MEGYGGQFTIGDGSWHASRSDGVQQQRQCKMAKATWSWEARSR